MNYVISDDKCLVDVMPVIDNEIAAKTDAKFTMINGYMAHVTEVVNTLPVDIINVTDNTEWADIINICRDGVNVYGLNKCDTDKYPITILATDNDAAIVKITVIKNISSVSMAHIEFYHNGDIYTCDRINNTMTAWRHDG